jgi:hypothetical protein
VVKGIQKFREHFRDYPESLVVMGGVACDEWLGTQGLAFRPTKDVDVVILLEALTPAFVERFWAFIRTGKYKVRQKSSGQRVYYRFSKPAEADYPDMIEVFSRQPEGIDLAEGQHVVPVRVDERLSGLSAILMDEAYYKLVLANRETVQNLPIVTVTALIPLKARAWSDLKRRREAGEDVDEDDIKKHRKDVFRLAAALPATPGPAIPASVREDLRMFVRAFPAESDEWANILKSLRATVGAAVPTPTDLLAAIDTYFALGGAGKEGAGA